MAFRRANWAPAKPLGKSAYQARNSLNCDVMRLLIPDTPSMAMMPDAVLQAIAVRCYHGVRKEDVIGRYGGEEFVVLLPDTPPPQRELTKRIQTLMAADPVHTHRDIPIMVSLGVATMQGETLRLSSLLTEADQALYHAKHRVE